MYLNLGIYRLSRWYPYCPRPRMAFATLVTGARDANASPQLLLRAADIRATYISTTALVVLGVSEDSTLTDLKLSGGSLRHSPWSIVVACE